MNEYKINEIITVNPNKDSMAMALFEKTRKLTRQPNLIQPVPLFLNQPIYFQYIYEGMAPC